MTTAAHGAGPARPSRESFPKASHLRRRSGFSRVFDAGRRIAAPALALHSLDAPQPRLGLAVSRKVDPTAIGRNRIKRVLRETFRKLRLQLACADYVVVARAPAAKLDNAALRAVFLQLLQRAGALPVPQADGTMRTACTAASPTPLKPDA